MADRRPTPCPMCCNWLTLCIPLYCRSQSILSRVMDVLSGPEPTAWEQGLTAAAMVGTCVVAYLEADPKGDWSDVQFIVAGVFAVMDGAAAVQCSTSQSKRWYHMGGQLSRKIVLIIIAETVVQCAAVGLLYVKGEADALDFTLRSSVWLTVCMIALVTVPLHAQRPASLLLFLASVALAQNHQVLPATPGISWMRIILPFKYLIAHLPRSEPYRV
jgi:hypothetical protein